MRRVLLGSLVLAICSVLGLAQDPPKPMPTVAPRPTPGPPPAAPKAPTTHLKVGDSAPDFELTDTAGKQVKLSDFKGKKNVVLAFYVLAFTGG